MGYIISPLFGPTKLVTLYHLLIIIWEEHFEIDYVNKILFSENIKDEKI
jgi:hypothetical protein